MYIKDYSSRKIVIIGIFILVAILFVIRLFYLQVIDNSYKLSAENIVLRYVTQYPARGRVFDRNGDLLVYNEAAYDLMVIPRQVKNPDTAALCKLLGIDVEDFNKQLKKTKRYSYYKPSVFTKQISKNDAGPLGEALFQFPGFYLQTRTLRHYPYPIAAHLLGSIGEVNNREIEKDAYYRSGDYIGKSGLEKHYEIDLRGTKGMKVLAVDVHNRDKGSYQNGKYDTLAVAGKDIYIGLDGGLQLYGERLMQNKSGSIVAIDPATGEILAMITSPGFDPNELVGRRRSANYSELQNDTLKPLMNRAISGTYPPGSTFKMINALVALQEKAIRAQTKFSCKGPLSAPIKCTHNHKSPLDLEEAIAQSCNPYFWNTFKSILNKTGDPKLGYEKWYTDVVSLGLGQKFMTDIPYEVSGNIPSKAYYDKLYRGSWNALTVRSLSIGQGEILVTPIQLANLVTILANKGFYYPPHLLHKMEGTAGIPEKFTTKINSAIEPKYFDIARNAMFEVFEGEHGTARYYKLDSIQQCGKTGTVQNPHGEDHSMFIAFAPMDNPKIAITVIVENAGYGSTWAAPIASLMMEKYINGSVSRKATEKRMLEGDLIHKNEKPKEQ